MSKRCICQICTCGRHRCPHNPNPRVLDGPCTFSEYTQVYKAHAIEPRVSFKPEQVANFSSDPLDDQTTNKTDYIRHSVEKPYKKPAQIWQAPEGQFDALTNYEKEFTQKPLENVRSYKPEEAKKNLSKFEGEPTYQSDYIKWSVDPRQTSMAPLNTYKPNEAPFEGNTNYHNDYVKYQGQALTKSLKPLSVPIKSDAPFDDLTDYNSTYIRHPLQEKEVREKQVWQPNTAPLDDISNYKRDYIAKEASRITAFKPDNKPYQSDAAFDETTTHKIDYLPWSGDLRATQKVAEKYHKPEGQMVFDSTTHKDYPGYITELPVKIGPRYDFKPSQGPFDDTTNYNSDFKQRQSEKTETYKPISTYQPTDTPFEGIPTYKTDYMGRQGPMVKSYKPVDSGYKSGAPMDDMTNYKMEYIKRVVSPCPAMHLDNDARYMFSEQDEIGHKWFYATKNRVATQG